MILHKEGISGFEPWCGAVDTWDNLNDYDKIDALESTLDELYPDGMTETELNDLLWFESQSIYEWVGLYYNENTGEVSDEPFPECHYCGEIISDGSEFEDENGDIWCKDCKTEVYDEDQKEYEEEEEN